MVQRAPNYPYMFSELPHFPATSYKCVPYMGANAYRLMYWALEGMSTRWHDHERSHAPHSRMSMSMRQQPSSLASLGIHTRSLVTIEQ